MRGNYILSLTGENNYDSANVRINAAPKWFTDREAVYLAYGKVPKGGGGGFGDGFDKAFSEVMKAVEHAARQVQSRIGTSRPVAGDFIQAAEIAILADSTVRGLNHDLGEATTMVANIAGETYLQMEVSKRKGSFKIVERPDGLGRWLSPLAWRSYRLPKCKKSGMAAGKVQSNFEHAADVPRGWSYNGHLTITDSTLPCP